MRLIRINPAIVALFSLFVFQAIAWSTQTSNLAWHTSTAPFRVLSLASDGSSIWACGTDAGIAVSADGGAHWELRHHTPDGNLLLNIYFVNNRFGYAAGTGGLILITDDGGKTWLKHSAMNATVLQISFSDSLHGLIRTPDSLKFTSDAGKSWSTVSLPTGSDILKTFPYTFSLAALDANHMAIMFKEGAAQYEDQTFLVTQDAGKSWQEMNIPNVTLYSFLTLQGKYWAVGTEVIDKDRPDGGHAVPVALYSADGVKWIHSSNNLSSCQLEMCVACTHQGCLSSDRTISDIFDVKTAYRTFPSDPKLTTKWAATNSAICFAGHKVTCTTLAAADKPTKGDNPVPAAVAPGPLGARAAQGPQCIYCELDQILVEPKVQGPFSIRLTIDVARDGTVTAVDAEGAPSSMIKSRIEQQVRQWLFEPYMKNGTRVNLKLHATVQINVIHPR